MSANTVTQNASWMAALQMMPMHYYPSSPPPPIPPPPPVGVGGHTPVAVPQQLPPPPELDPKEWVAEFDMRTIEAPFFTEEAARYALRIAADPSRFGARWKFGRSDGGHLWLSAAQVKDILLIKRQAAPSLTQAAPVSDPDAPMDPERRRVYENLRKMPKALP